MRQLAEVEASKHKMTQVKETGWFGFKTKSNEMIEDMSKLIFEWNSPNTVKEVLTVNGVVYLKSDIAFRYKLSHLIYCCYASTYMKSLNEIIILTIEVFDFDVMMTSLLVDLS